MKHQILIQIFLSLLFCNWSFAANEVVGWEKLQTKFGLNLYHPKSQKLNEIKIAILDNGFEGYNPEKGLLPKTTELINLTQIGPASTSHGLGMAQIIWALTGKHSDGPKFYLVNSNGFSNLKAAVQFVIDNKIDLVLYSQVWPFGGNLDGTGFIDELVTKAAQENVIWINAAGNYGKMVYNGLIEEHNNPRSQFFHFTGKDYLSFENKLDENTVTVTLTWTDFKNDENYSTPQDLDLYIYDETDHLMGASEWVQKGEAPPPGKDSNLSSHAREVVLLQGLDRGHFKIKIKSKSNNFSSSDQFRILIKTERSGSIHFTDHSKDGEIMPPADHPLAITVGELADDSAVGPTRDGRRKPDTLIQDATIAFTNGAEYRGSSNAAAIFAGIATVLRASEPTLTSEKLRKYVAEVSNFKNYNDLLPVDNMPLDPKVRQILPTGSQVMLSKSNGHYVILTQEDPFSLPGARKAGIRRVLQDDVLAYSLASESWLLIPKSVGLQIRPPFVEFRQAIGSQSGIWRTPDPTQLAHFLGTTPLWVSPHL